MTESAISTDPVLTAVLANRMDGIVRDMTNTMLRAARSPVIANARDFSCAITTADDRLLAGAAGEPVHIFGSHLQTSAMKRLHKDTLAEGDAFLHNDPYDGNSHPADQTVLAPVFFEGEHVFTVCVKAHQADIGNSIPTTYHPAASDVYEEGCLIFPCVRVQRDYEMVDDIIRMGMRRIRIPDQWYGDLLAAIGAARIAERRLKDVCAKYSRDVVKRFIEDWFDYSEKRAEEAIRALPKARVVNEGVHDRIVGLMPEGIPIKVILDIDPEAGEITVDLRENPDNQPCGFNLTEATATNNALAGVFNALDADIPHNAGSFRRLNVLLREGCIVGKPEFPFSCSMATTNIACRLINLVGSAFAQLGDGFGLAHGGTGISGAAASISGRDFRQDNAPYVGHLILQAGGGPGTANADGWVTYALPGSGGVIYRDSIELNEIKHPVHFNYMRLSQCAGGAGKHRGAPGVECSYSTKGGPMTVVIATDCIENPAKGVRGGQDGLPTRNQRVAADGTVTDFGSFNIIEVQPGEEVQVWDSTGGGYGPPLERDPQRVLKDVLEGWETRERAHDVYGVVISGEVGDETLAVDEPRTEARRAEMNTVS